MNVFLSFVKEDRTYAMRLANALRIQGVKILDVVEDPSADDAFSLVQNALTRTDLFVFIVPEHEGQSNWALMELGAAKALNKRIIGIVPSFARFANSDVARRLSSEGLIDAEGLTAGELAVHVLASQPLAA